MRELPAQRFLKLPSTCTHTPPNLPRCPSLHNPCKSRHQHAARCCKNLTPCKVDTVTQTANSARAMSAPYAILANLVVSNTAAKAGVHATWLFQQPGIPLQPAAALLLPEATQVAISHHLPLLLPLVFHLPTCPPCTPAPPWYFLN